MGTTFKITRKYVRVLTDIGIINNFIFKKSEMIKNYSVARSVKTIDPEIRDILILTFCPGFAFATYII